MNVIPTHSIVIIHYVHQQNKYFHHIFKRVDIALPISTKENLHYENNKKNNTYIKMGNPPLERLWDGQYPYISQQKVIVSQVICEILYNMKKFAH